MPTNPVPAAATGLPDEPKLVEHYVCLPTYSDGVAYVDIAPNGNARLVLYAEQRDAYDGQVERTIVARIVIPQAALVDAIGKIMTALNAAPDVPAWASPQMMGGRA